MILLVVACGAPRPQAHPDLLLVVLDTVRADAVSAMGGPPGATPNLDALAAKGLLYTRAFAGGPWTLPSHVSLFTGLRLDQHGVGVAGRVTAPETVEMLAERLRDAGYETVGFSENPLISRPFNLTQGFEHFRSSLSNEAGADPLNIVDAVSRWANQRDPDRPYFLFVNFFDAHLPYAVRKDNPWLAEGVSAHEARQVEQSTLRICDRLPPVDELAILRGLYYGDVASADAKLGALLERLEDAQATDSLISVVTSDHGEHFGEQRLLVHQFSVSNRLLHVPLVVHGLPGVAAARIDVPVELGDVVPSVLGWLGLPVPDTLPGVELPTRELKPPPARAFVAGYSDAERTDWPAQAGASRAARIPDAMRATCGPADRALGDMLSIVRYPYKLIWFDRYPAALYDLSWDPQERSDQRLLQPEIARRLRSELEPFIESARTARAEAAAARPSPEAVEALRELGYIE